MTPIKACIFDLDGVVVDTAVYHYQAWKRLADELNIQFTEHDNERLKGVSRMRSLDIILEIGGVTLDEATKLELATRKNAWYVDFITKMTPDEILPGVEAFIHDLRKKGIKIALGSASKNSMTILERINLLPLFDAIVDGNKVSNAKPDPEVFLIGAEALGATPDQCVVFEDAVAGVEAAINAKMYCVGVGSPEILHQAPVVIQTFEGLTLQKLEALLTTNTIR